MKEAGELILSSTHGIFGPLISPIFVLPGFSVVGHGRAVSRPQELLVLRDDEGTQCNVLTLQRAQHMRGLDAFVQGNSLFSPADVQNMLVTGVELLIQSRAGDPGNRIDLRTYSHLRKIRAS